MSCPKINVDYPVSMNGNVNGELTHSELFSIPEREGGKALRAWRVSKYSFRTEQLTLITSGYNFLTKDVIGFE